MNDFERLDEWIDNNLTIEEAQILEDENWKFDVDCPSEIIDFIEMRFNKRVDL